MNKRQLVLGLVVLVTLVVLGVYAQHRHPIDWHEVVKQLVQARWINFAFGVGCIYFAYLFRAARWAYLLRHYKKVHTLSLVGTQVMGFTAVALIGRVADPVRPYLTAKRTGLSISNQLAVYVVERLFDFGTMAIFFSIAMIVLFQHQNASSALLIQSTHSGFFAKIAGPKIAEFGGLILTFCGVVFLIIVRLSGSMVAALFERTLGIISTRLGRAVGDKIRTFQNGLNTFRSFSDFWVVSGISFAMWVVIALAYYSTMRGFSGSPELSSINISQAIVLMMISGGASVFQLPVLGWFTQIIAVAAVLATIFQAGKEASTACAAMLLLVTFLSVIPIGLIWAQFENISLRKVTHDSELAEEVAAAHPGTTPDHSQTTEVVSRSRDTQVDAAGTERRSGTE